MGFVENCPHRCHSGGGRAHGSLVETGIRNPTAVTAQTFIETHHGDPGRTYKTKREVMKPKVALRVSVMKKPSCHAHY
jgi:hypothetical protein